MQVSRLNVARLITICAITNMSAASRTWLLDGKNNGSSVSLLIRVSVRTGPLTHTQSFSVLSGESTHD